MNDCIIKLYRSATIGIITNTYKLLCDPWLVDGEYYGSWSHYPPFDLEKNLSEINSYDGIYISHIHPDHCSEKTLNKIKKSIPIYIHAYHSKFLKFKIEKLGFKVIELTNAEKKKLSDFFDLKIYAADNCDPKLCYKFYGCADINEKKQSQQIDSISVISVNGFNILNVNDCPYELSSKTVNQIVKSNEIDVIMVGYGGAGPYPQCFENLSISEKKKEAKKKKETFLERSINYIKQSKAKFYLPFAGTYYLTGRLSNLQNLRGVPTLDEAYEFIDASLKKENINCSKIQINPGSEFSLLKKQSSENYKKIDSFEVENYLHILSKKTLSYQDQEEPSFEELYKLAVEAHSKYIKKVKLMKIKLDSDVILKTKSKFIHINNSKNSISEIKPKKVQKLKKYVVYELDSRLLKNILLGPRFAHWNNAEIGSHIKFFRKPDIYERKLYNAMNYFHN